jgi:hypothetical protein
MDFVKPIYGPLTRRAARRALLGRMRAQASPEEGRFTRGDVTRLLDAAWVRYEAALESLPTQPTMGSTMNVRLACFTFSFFEELLAAGTEREYAIELVADATWQVYQSWARLASAAGRLGHGKSSALAFAVTDKGNGGATVHLRFPFNSPGYVIETVPAEHGTAFNVVHCPVAEFFRARGAADLCVASWCNLDFPLSELTHQKLVRTKTLVQGADHCDFRVLPRERS